MKKIIAILVFVALGAQLFAQTATADTTTQDRTTRESYRQTLIDFTKLDPINEETLAITYGDNFVLSLPEEEVANIPKLNYGLQNWRILPISSISTPMFFEESLVKGVQAVAGKYAGETLLGVKVKFPAYNFAMSIDISPPFTAPNIPDETGNYSYVGNGLLRNVGAVKSAYLTVYGLNQSESIYLVTEDSAGDEYQYPFGKLEFVGWRTLEWVNPRYIEDVRNRELDTRPVYPKFVSDRRIKAIKIRREASSETTDFVTYIRNADLTYDLENNLDLYQDFPNDEVWNIIGKSVTEREAFSVKRDATRKYFEYLESRKKYDSERNANNNNAAGQ